MFGNGGSLRSGEFENAGALQTIELAPENADFIGALLSLAPNGGGGRHFVSSIMTTIGIIGMLVTIIGAARRN